MILRKLRFATIHTIAISKEDTLPEKMGFLVGATCFAPSPPVHFSRFLTSPSTSQFVLLCSSSNVANSKRRRPPPSASLRRQDAHHDEVYSAKRRDFVLLGVSVLPFLEFQSPAMADESEFYQLLLLHCRNSRVLLFLIFRFVLVIILL